MVPVKESSSKGECLKTMIPVKESASKGEFLKRMVSPLLELSFTGTIVFQESISPTIPGLQPFSPQIIWCLLQSNSVVQSKKRKHALNLFSDIFKYF